MKCMLMHEFVVVMDMQKCDHGEIYNEISDENLKLMRERLLETIQWPLDDTTKPDQ